MYLAYECGETVHALTTTLQLCNGLKRILARVAVSSACVNFFFIIFLKYILSDKLSLDLPDRFSPDFHHIVGFWS